MNDLGKQGPNETNQASVDAARTKTLEQLARNVIGASLTVDEYAQRVAAVREAASTEELDNAALGLPAETAAAPARHARWLVAVFGGTEQRGRWRLGRHMWVVVAFGGAKLDVGAAQPEAAESVITVVALFGGAEINAPEGVPIQLSGLSLLGGKSDKRAGGPPLPGSPLIRVRVLAILGGVTVKGKD